MTSPVSTFEYDLIVIGAGSGGMAAARRGADKGMKVAVFEGALAGGTCVNAGCVPKKLLVHASRVRDHIAEMPDLGWHSAAEAEFDWVKLRRAVNVETQRLSEFHRQRMVDKGIEFIPEFGVLKGANEVEGHDGRTASADTILIATGAKPMIPPFDGGDLCMVSDDIFAMDVLPRTLAIIGGGYIACEFACILHRFGVQVTIYERSNRLIAPFDPEVSALLETSMRSDGIAIHLETSIGAVERSDGGLRVLLDGAQAAVEYQNVLAAIGRAPNTDGLRLGETGVEVADRGHIIVDEYGRTSVPSVYATGDVTQGLALTPVAVRGGRRIIDTISSTSSVLPPPELVPTAAFTTPECGSVGMTEAQAERADKVYSVRHMQFNPLANLLSDDDSKVFMKCLVERDSGLLLGFHFFGPAASEAAQLGALALGAGLTEARLHQTMALHPSTAEEIIGLGRPDEPLHQKPEIVA